MLLRYAVLLRVFAWLLVPALAPPVFGQSASPKSHHWEKVTTTNGCSFYRWISTSSDDLSFHSYVWNGKCSADKLISGRGTLFRNVKPGKEMNGPRLKRVSSTIAGNSQDGLFIGSSNWCSEAYKEKGMLNGCMTVVFNKGCTSSDTNRIGCVPGTAPSPTQGQPRMAQGEAANTRPPAPSKVIAMSPNSTKGCLSLITDPGSFGGFRNSCKISIDLAFCVAEIRKIPGGQWSDAFACEEGKFGATKVPAMGTSGDHTKGGQVHYVACQSPQYPVQLRYEKGRGALGLCK